MEQIINIAKSLLVAVLVLSASKAVFSQEKAAVDYRAKETRLVQVNDSSVVKLIGDVFLVHNGAIISCDSAYRYSERRFEAYGKVIINQDSLYIYGDKVVYNGETDVARVLSDLIKIVDGDVTMYTRDMYFNTKTKIGYFSKGATLRQQESLMEATSGTYDSENKLITLSGSVAMENEEYILKTTELDYNQNIQIANFNALVHIWNVKGEYLQAKKGKYEQINNIYHFEKDSYILTDEQEVWSDSLIYFSDINEVELKRNIQINDTVQKASSFGDYGYFWNLSKKVFMTKDPAAFTYDDKQRDSVYVSADTIIVAPILEKSNMVDSLTIGGVEGGILDSLNNTIDSMQMLVDTTLTVEDRVNEAIEDIDSDVLAKGVATANALSGVTSLAEGVNVLRDAVGDKELAKGSEVLREKVDAETMAKGVALATQLSNVKDVDEGLDIVRNSVDTTTINRGADIVRESAKGVVSADMVDKGIEAAKSAVGVDMAEVADTLAVADTIVPEISFEGMTPEEIRDTLLVINNLPRFNPLYSDEQIAEMDERKQAKAIKKNAKYAKKFDKELNRFLKDLEYIERLEEEKALADSLATKPAEEEEVTEESKTKEVSNVADSSDMIITAFMNAKVYRKDMQSIADTMIVETVDSTTTSIGAPIAWNMGNQITAGRIRSYVKDGSINRTRMFNNPMMAQQVEEKEEMYNQMSGKTMDALYRDQAIYRLIVTDNSIARMYREEPDSESNKLQIVAFITSQSKNMIIDMNNSQITRVKWIGATETETYPMEMLPKDLKFLEGFEWKPDLRPTKEDVFNKVIRPSERSFMKQIKKPNFVITRDILRDRESLINGGTWVDRNDKLKVNREELIRQSEMREIE